MKLKELIDYTSNLISDPVSEKLFKNTIIRFLNAGLKDFCSKTNIYEIIETSLSVIDQSDYSTTFADGVELFFIKDLTFDNERLYPLTIEELYLRGNWHTEGAGTPKFFCALNSGNFTLIPAPDTADKSIKVFGFGTPKTAEMFSGANLESVSPISSRWDMALIYFAAKQAALSLGLSNQVSVFSMEYDKYAFQAKKDSKRFKKHYSFLPIKYIQMQTGIKEIY